MGDISEYGAAFFHSVEKIRRSQCTLAIVVFEVLSRERKSFSDLEVYLRHTGFSVAFILKVELYPSTKHLLEVFIFQYGEAD